MFKNYNQASWRSIIFAVVAFVILTLIWLNPLLPIALAIGQATGGIIHPTLVIGLTDFALITGALIWFGRLRWQDFGFVKTKFASAIVLTIILWVLLNAIILIVGFVQGAEVALDSAWQNRGAIVLLGILISQLFGNALLEETVFRGFLIPQLYFKLGGSKTTRQNRKLIGAAVLSLIAFTVPHLGNLSNIGGENTFITMLSVFIIGAILSMFYLMTRNIFLTIGYHALINDPTPVFQGPSDAAEIIVVILGIILALGWRFLPSSRDNELMSY